MSRNERNEAIWRLAVEIEGKENAPASQRDCSEVRDLRKRFGDLVHKKSREAGGLQEGDWAESPIANCKT